MTYLVKLLLVLALCGTVHAEHNLFGKPCGVTVIQQAPRTVVIERVVEETPQPQRVIQKTPTPAVQMRGYPTHSIRWDIEGDMGASKAKTLRHMQTHSNHRAKFPASWLAALSNAELRSLHDDDHEGRVKWQYVPFTPMPEPAPVKRVTKVYQPSSNCPGGVCPTHGTTYQPLFRFRRR